MWQTFRQPSARGLRLIVTKEPGDDRDAFPGLDGIVEAKTAWPCRESVRMTIDDSHITRRHFVQKTFSNPPGKLPIVGPSEESKLDPVWSADEGGHRNALIHGLGQ